MSRPNEERQVRIDVDELTASFRTVNRWLDANEKFLRQPPAEHYIMTELNEQRFVERNRRRQPPRSNGIPPPVLPSLIKYPKEPAYAKPQWSYYTIDTDTVGNHSGAETFRTSHGMAEQKLSMPTCAEIEMQTLKQQTSKPKEAGESSKDAVVYFF